MQIAEKYCEPQMPLYITHKMCDGHHLVFTSEFNPRIDELSPDQLAEQNAD